MGSTRAQLQTSVIVLWVSWCNKWFVLNQLGHLQFFSYFIKMQKNYLHGFKIWTSILYTNKTYLFLSDRLNNAHLRSSIFCFKQRSVISRFSEMTSSGDLRSGDLFLDQHHPPWPNLPPSSNFAGKTWIYLSGTSIGWILIQSDSPLYRSNKEESIFFLLSTNNVHHARKWGQKP